MKLIGAPITTLSFYRRASRVDEAGPGDVSDGRRCISDRTFLHCMSGPELEHVRTDAGVMRGTSLPCFFVEAMPHKSSKESRHSWRDNLSTLSLPTLLLSQIERSAGASRFYASRGAVRLLPALSHRAVRPSPSGRDIDGWIRLRLRPRARQRSALLALSVPVEAPLLVAMCVCVAVRNFFVSLVI